MKLIQKIIYLMKNSTIHIHYISKTKFLQTLFEELKQWQETLINIKNISIYDWTNTIIFINLKQWFLLWVLKCILIRKIESIAQFYLN